MEKRKYTKIQVLEPEMVSMQEAGKTHREIADLQSALEALSADEFTDERPSQKKDILLTIHLDNENFPQIRIALYRYDGTRCLAVVDGKSVSLVNRADVVSLTEAVHSIVLGKSEPDGNS